MLLNMLNRNDLYSKENSRLVATMNWIDYFRNNDEIDRLEPKEKFENGTAIVSLE